MTRRSTHRRDLAAKTNSAILVAASSCIAGMACWCVSSVPEVAADDLERRPATIHRLPALVFEIESVLEVTHAIRG